MENPQLIESQINDYLAALGEQSVAGKRLRSPSPTNDTDGFFRLVGMALERQQEVDGAKQKIFYAEDFPEKDDNLEGEAIIYSLVDRKPGTFEGQKTGLQMADTNIRHRGKIFQESIEDPDYAGSRVYTYSQWYDNLLRFEIYARTNKIANKRAIWFENFMDDWTWYFKANGIRGLEYKCRESDIRSALDNRKLVCRPMVYFLRTEKITHVREHTLRSLVLASSLE